MRELAINGNKLKELRTSAELSMDMVVADMNQRYTIELNKSMLSRWENGKSDPSLRMASYLCKYYNVSLDYLIDLTDTKTPTRLLRR